MPLFKYRASGPDGKPQDVLIEGDSQADSMRRLRARGLLPLACLGLAEHGTRDNSLKNLFRASFDACDFSNRLAPLLEAHIPLEKALGIIADGTDDERSRETVNELRRGLHEGKKFSALIRDQGARFPNVYANLVEAGEESGSLPEVIAELDRFLTERRELREFMLTSSIYPAIVLSVTFGVIVLLFTVFVPRFSRIFLDMGKPLPLPTKIMLNISQIAVGGWWIWLLLAAGLIFLIREIRRGGKAGAWWDRTSLKIPLFGKLAHASDIARFLRTLAILTGRHVHLLDTVSIASRVLGNSVIAQSFAGVASDLRGGANLSRALSRSEFMPEIALQMLAIGEESGNVGGMLTQVADHYEQKLRLQVKRLLSLFEPAVILFLAIVVLAVVISIFMAIMEMNQI